MQEINVGWDQYNSWFCNTTDPRELTKVAITWRAARYFRRHWGNENGIGRNRASVYKKISASEAISTYEELYNMLEIGDVVQYGDPNDHDHPYHTQIIHDKRYNEAIGRNDLFMAQHTRNVKNVSFYRYLDAFEDKERQPVYIYKM